jgi:hypothetical protein
MGTGPRNQPITAVVADTKRGNHADFKHPDVFTLIRCDLIDSELQVIQVAANRGKEELTSLHRSEFSDRAVKQLVPMLRSNMATC